MSEPFKPSKNQESLAKSLESIQRLGRLGDSLSSLGKIPFLEKMASQQAELERVMKPLPPQHSIPELIIADCVGQLSELTAITEKALRPYDGLLKAVQSQASQFQGMLDNIQRQAIPALSLAQIFHTEMARNISGLGLAERMKGIGLLEQNANLAVRLFEPHIVYTKFVGQTTDRLMNDSPPEMLLDYEEVWT